MEGEKGRSTILQRKKKTVKINKEETLLMLHYYQSHPTNWGHIIDEMKENLDHLPGPVKELYTTSTVKKIRDRLSNKFGKLMREKAIEDDDIRSEVEAISQLERRLVKSNTYKIPASCASTPDVREAALEAFSDSDEGSKSSESRRASTVQSVPSTFADYVPAASPMHKASRKRPLMDLVRENQLQYNRFITKKVPKLLRELGVSSDESD